MQNGEYVLAVHGSCTSYYAKVRLQVELDETQHKLVVDLKPDPTYHLAKWTRWQIDAQFGCAYVWEVWASTQPVQGKGLKVHILELQGMPGDTTQLTVAFATAHALLQALQWTPEDSPTFDSETGQ